MWPTNAADGPHEDGENDGLLCEMEDAVGNDGMVNGQRSPHEDVKGSKRDLFKYEYNRARPVERRAHPGYPKFETQGSDKLDWRDVTIVSKVLSTLFSTYTSRRLLLSVTQALCQLTTHCVLFTFLLFTVILLLLKRACSLLSYSLHPNLSCPRNQKSQQPHLHSSASPQQHQTTTAYRLCRPTDEIYFSDTNL